MFCQRIATLTINPALDESTTVPHVTPDRKLRCAEPVREPGGGGINVARVIRRLGGEAIACLPAGGPTGQLLVSLLDAEGVQHRVVPVGGWTRQNLHVFESASRRQFRFCMPGAPLAEVEWCRVLDALVGLEPAPDLVVLSGSLAPGVPVDFYLRASEALRRRGARVVLDSSVEAVLPCIGHGVFLLKASIHEFEGLTGVTGVDEARLAELSAAFVARGACDVLVVSLGAGGALWTTKNERERLIAPAVPVHSTVGAGDSMVAGIVLALAQGRTLRESMRYGVAAGCATVMRPGTALCRLEDVERLYPHVSA
jgi:6-phosphofructokinase 2